MARAIILLTLALSANLLFAADQPSQLVVLYKFKVASGNSMVSFISHNDPTGQYAAEHCEKLKELYMSRERIPYICSTVVFSEFKPTLK